MKVIESIAKVYLKHMPNGFTGSPAIWNKAQAALSVIDSVVAECIQDHDVTIIRDYHSWPSRSVEWATDPLQRKVQIYLSSENEQGYNVWLCASKETEGTVLWRQEFLRQNVVWEVLSGEIREVLMQAVQIVDSWTADDLVPTRKV